MVIFYFLFGDELSFDLGPLLITGNLIFCVAIKTFTLSAVGGSSIVFILSDDFLYLFLVFLIWLRYIERCLVGRDLCSFLTTESIFVRFWVRGSSLMAIL